MLTQIRGIFTQIFHILLLVLPMYVFVFTEEEKTTINALMQFHDVAFNNNIVCCLFFHLLTYSLLQLERKKVFSRFFFVCVCMLSIMKREFDVTYTHSSDYFIILPPMCDKYNRIWGFCSAPRKCACLRLAVRVSVCVCFMCKEG